MAVLVAAYVVDAAENRITFRMTLELELPVLPPEVVQTGSPAVETVRTAPVEPDVAEIAVMTRFVWDWSAKLIAPVLGGADFNYFENIIEDRGRSISIQWDQTGLNETMELFGYSVRFYQAEPTAKEQV